MENKEELKQEVQDKLDELRYEYDDEYELYERIRDEFDDEIYDDILIELGINDKDESLGLKEIEDDDDKYITDDKDKPDGERVLNKLFGTDKRLKDVYKMLKGINPDTNKRENISFLIPRKDIDSVMLFLKGLYSPQVLMSNLSYRGLKFDSDMNAQLHNIRRRLARYPNNIVPEGVSNRVISYLLAEVSFIKTAVEDGNFGDKVVAILVGSYDERNQPEKREKEVDDIRKKFNI